MVTPIMFAPLAVPEPMLSYALDAKNQGDEDKLANALHEICEEDVVLHPPRVPYQATITRPASGSYRHEKQTGCAGQFAEIHMEIKPTARGAGFHIVDVRAEVFDGKMHPVDSKDIAFQMAGRQLMKQLMLEGRPILLEPVMSVRVDVPIEAMGDVMGDLTSRRGRVQGVEAEGHREQEKILAQSKHVDEGDE